ncbi:Leukotriene-B(4) omega-hydroxylase 2 [Seminavis robusta]|uniref:Leukotriene-B(4) omega-hydroxylase 2 n=1 Tax=Seminavis robusta TaxID=568900 RepID=A0A9N8EUB8_9STRA|nr:Leukotriene-B(4) omega-hydroxylase 2 [Seminavis robusta]|eukprot:Sro1901_g304390.1 Leukotriene-B(4) omega-hydroxylase 2 (343) ;mRNA; r:19948-20976
MKSVTLGIFCKTALNFEVVTGEDGMSPCPQATAFEYLSEQMMKRFSNPLWPRHFFYWIPTEQNRQQIKEQHFVRSFLTNLITEKRKSIEESHASETDKDLLTHLLKAHNTAKSMGIVEAEQVTDDNLTDILMSLFSAGYDTTSMTLCTALYLLAQHPQAQEHCVREIQNTKGGLVDPHDLVYCRAVILEALRMYPPVVTTLRTMTKPVELSGGLVIPKDSDEFVPIYGIHHDENLFALPSEFRPDRWVSAEEGKEGCWMERSALDDSGEIPAANHSNLLAFSAGGRNCVGMKFAIQEAVLVLANLLKGLEFAAVPSFELKSSNQVILHKPDNGVLLNVSTRV